VGFLFEQLAQSKQAAIEKLEPQVQKLTANSARFTQAYTRLQATQKESDQITLWLADRYYWGDVLSQLRLALIRSEGEIKKKLSAQKPNVEAGIWIDQMTTMGNLQTSGMASGYPGNPNPAPVTDQNQNQIGSITLICRAVNLSSVDPSANSEIAYAVESELKACPVFDPKGTQLSGQITPDDSNGTFTFGIAVALLNPLKF
jgi:hypothetical protein